MYAIKYDAEHEQALREFKTDGIRALELQKSIKINSEQDLANALISIDPDEISRLIEPTWQEMLDEQEPELLDELVGRRRITQLWLSTEGWKIFDEKYHPEAAVWLGNFYTYWMETMFDAQDSKAENYYKPSMLQWSLFLTLRGDIPQSFPEDGIYTYALKRYLDLLTILDNYGLLEPTETNREQRRKLFTKTIGRWKSRATSDLRKIRGEVTAQLHTKPKLTPETHEVIKKTLALQREGYTITSVENGQLVLEKP